MARYYAEQALGMLETVGMVPAIEACDKMLKAAEVELISYENVGSTLVTMFVKGDVAAVKSSVKAGVEAAEKIGKVTAHDTIPRPIRPIGDVVSIYDVDAQCSERGDRRGRCRRLQDGSCCRCESCRRNGQGSLQLGGHRASASWDQKDHIPVFVGKIAACSSGIKTLNTRMATGKR